MIKCRCQIAAICMEVKKPGLNRGRWYWVCATGSCRFFQWDNSAYAFITHPTEAYAAIEPVNGRLKRPPTIPFMYIRGKDSVLPKTTVKVAFLVLSGTQIGIKVQRNLTLDPVISRIENIAWNEELGLWTLPATTRDYKNALRAFQTNLPNIQIDVDPVPDAVFEKIVEQTEEAIENPDVIGEIELKWTEFVESPIRKKLCPFQQEGVRLGIERRGRILFGNENGLGMMEQALALANVYRDEWPVLLICHPSLCRTWKQSIISFLDLEEDEISIIDNLNGPLFKANNQISKKRKLNHRAFANDSVSNTPAKNRKPYKARIRSLREKGYDSSESTDSEGDQQNSSDNVIYNESRSSQIKFHIASFNKASKNKSKISEQKFRVIICDGSHFLKHKDLNLSKNIRKLLQDHPRAIMLSDTALCTLPIDLFTQIDGIKQDWLLKYERYIQRYCNPRNTVFGVNINGKSNMEELDYLLNRYVWYCPNKTTIKPQLTDIVHQPIFLQLEKSDEKKELLALLETMNTECSDFSDYTDMQDLMIKSNSAKRPSICNYFDYVFETYKRPKLAFLYSDKENKKMVLEILKKRKAKATLIENLEDISEKINTYNNSHSVQIVFVDMDLDFSSESLSSVDIAILIDLPKSKTDLKRIESLFQDPNRESTLIIKYLIAVESIDEYLWSNLKFD